MDARRLKLLRSRVICCGWRHLPLCWLDIVTRCRVRRVCDLHDRIMFGDYADY